MDKKYLITPTTIVPIYTPENYNIDKIIINSTNIKLPSNYTNYTIVHNSFVHAYFNTIQTGNLLVESIDNYNTTRFYHEIICNKCKVIIQMGNVYYHKKNNYCLECYDANNDNTHILRVNHFKPYFCDICNKIINGWKFYHNIKIDYDVCMECVNTNNNDINKIIIEKQLILTNNNIIDPVGYTFGSVKEWIPIIKFDNNNKLIFQHYNDKERFAIGELSDRNSIKIIKYEELHQYSNIEDVLKYTKLVYYPDDNDNISYNNLDNNTIYIDI
jgi:hypothetical protein